MAERFLGLNLAGARNTKTSLVALEHYPRERKTFVLDVYDQIGLKPAQSPDDALIELLDELRQGPTLLGVDVPLTAPPCLGCPHKRACASPDQCRDPQTKWMRAFARQHASKKDPTPFVTPYTQRPVELWVRHQLLPELQPWLRFEIDEALGGNKAPLTARMLFLQKFMPKGVELVETWPKLTLARLAARMPIAKRALQNYRNLEEGARAREEILELLARAESVFIYDRDALKLATNLNAFDAFLAAFAALLSAHGRTVKPPKSFPKDAGWIAYPDIPSAEGGA